MSLAVSDIRVTVLSSVSWH